MKKAIKYLIVGIILLSSCTERERIVPEKPFIVIYSEPYKYQTTETGMEYKIMDKNGYVFHFKEHLLWRSNPRYLVGDTLK